MGLPMHMPARDWFEQIRADVVECARLEDRLRDMRSALGPRTQKFDAVGHGTGASDGSAAILRVVNAEAEYDRRQAQCNDLVEEALVVLYGRDGRGGLAKERSCADADCICGYYLLGMTWREVADEMVRPESMDGPQWCKRRAYRALGHIDRHRGRVTDWRMEDEGDRGTEGKRQDSRAHRDRT